MAGDITSNLYAHYEFLSGAENVDSASGLTLTPHNTPTYGAGPFTDFRAAIFNGTNQYADNASANMDDVGVVTVAFWVYMAADSYGGVAVQYGTDNTTSGNWGVLPSHNEKWYVSHRTDVGPNSALGAGHVGYSAWHHVVVTFDVALSDPEYRVYYDSSLLSLTPYDQYNNGSGSHYGTSKTLYVGGSASASWWAGQISDLRIYKRAFTQDDVDLLYAWRPSAPLGPTITSSTTFNVDENTTAVGTLTADGDTPITWSITGGGDGGSFDIDPDTAALVFLSAPDYENPTDQDLDNVYEVEVTATNATDSDAEVLLVTVRNVGESTVEGLVGYWQLDEAAGANNAVDATGFYNLTQHGSPGSTGGVIGTARTFDAASSQYFSNTILSGTTTVFSISAWLSRASTDDWNYVGFSDADFLAWPYFTDESTGRHHYAIVYDGGEAAADRVKVYIDAVAQLLTEGPGGWPAASYDITGTFDVGRVIYGEATYYATGNVDEVSLWNLALAEADIIDLYNGGAGLDLTGAAGTAPVITSGSGATAAYNVAENTTAVVTVTATGSPVPSWSITGGADAAKFGIGVSTGVLVFLAAPDYEDPQDLDTNNTYVVEVTATNSEGADVQTITATVTAVTDIVPVITSNSGGPTASISVAENTTAVTTVQATADATVTYSKSGTDAAKFDINSSSGVLVFHSAPDYDAPTDADANNVYLVTVVATTAAGADSQDLSVTVTNAVDVVPVITSNGGGPTAAINVVTGRTAVTTVVATADTTIVYGKSGTDHAKFDIDTSTGVLVFHAAPDVNTPTDANTDNVYLVTVTATTAAGADSQDLSVTVVNQGSRRRGIGLGLSLTGAFDYG